MALTIAAAPAPSGADEVTDAEGRVAAAEAEIARLRADYVVLADQARGAGGQADQARLRVLSLHRAIDDAANVLNDAKYAVAQRAKRAYMGDALGNLHVLLRVQDYAQIDAYYPYVVRPLEEDRRTAVVYAARLTSLRALQTQMDSAQQEATRKAGTLETLERSLAANLDRQQATLQQAKRDLAEAKRIQAERELRAPSFSGFVPRGPQRGSGPGPEAGIPDPTDIPAAPRFLPNGVELGPTAGIPAGMRGSGTTFSGVASWYGPGFHGWTTANGETYDQYGFTAASRTLPFDTVLLVTHKGRSVLLRVNDRGPVDEGRVLDLSKGAADALGVGLGYVDAEVVIPVE